MNNIRMNEEELSVMVKNEVEWRKLMWRKIENIEFEQKKQDKVIEGLKIKVSFFGGIFGFLGGLLVNYFNVKK